jgi:hypothetical protein
MAHLHGSTLEKHTPFLPRLRVPALLCLVLPGLVCSPVRGQTNSSRRLVPPSSAWLSVASTPTPADAGVTREIWIGLRGDGLPGDGTLASPFNGTGAGFDSKMRELSVTNALNDLHIHLLPGTYVTAGARVWTPRSGWWLHGAGMDLTTVQLVNPPGNAFAVIGMPVSFLQTNITVSDLTVDCHYSTTNANKAAAVALLGSRHTIRRVRAIHAYGVFPAAETFLLSIATVGASSEGNVIEYCDVSDFRGSYCTAIAFGGPLPPFYIQGIIRANRVVDLHSEVAQSVGIGYGAGGFNNVIFEYNVADRCDVAVNLDTGRSRSATLTGNQFYRCRGAGVQLAGQDLDSFTVENNLIEIEPTARGAALLLNDNGGVGRLRNFVIRNNTIRSLNGLPGFAYGLAIQVVNGESILVAGNRVDAGLRNSFPGRGTMLFDNTDLQGRPLVGLPGAEGAGVALPFGERGTLLLNKGNAHLVADAGPTPATNGANLLAAYARAKTMRPHGLPLSATNQVTLFLWPGQYLLAGGALVLDTEFVDLVGLGAAGTVRLESEGHTLTQTANDVTIENVTLHCASPLPPTFTAADRAAYVPTGALGKSVLRRCQFTGGGGGWGMALGANYAGRYEDCVCGPRGWGGPGTFSGVAVNCRAGDYSFAAGGAFTGAATNCTAGIGSFGGAGGAGFHGIARNCTAGHDSFGGSGLMLGCEVLGAVSAATATTGRLTDCRIGPAPGNLAALVLGAGATLHNCTVLANPAGTGFSIDAPVPVRARISHCRLNHSLRNVVNDVAQPFNVDDPNVE